MDDRRCTPTATHSFQLPIIQPHTFIPSLQPNHLPLHRFIRQHRSMAQKIGPHQARLIQYACTLSACQYYLPVTQGGHPTPIPLSPRKRSLGSDTNIPPLSVDKSNKKTKKASPHTPDERLKVVFDQLKELHRTLGQFMYHLVELDDEKGQRVHRKSQHAAFVQQFL